MKVFLSYSRRDTEFVDRLDNGLNALGYDVWIDREDIGASQEDRWRRSVVKAIRESDVVVLVLSPNSTHSESVERELTVAADNSKRVVPVLHRECELPDGFQYELAGIQYVDFTLFDFDEGVRRLATQIGPVTALLVAGAPTTDVVAAGPPSVDRPTEPSKDGRRRRGVVIASAVTALLAIAIVAFALTRSGADSTSSESSPTEPATVTAPSEQPVPSEQEEAESVVGAWAEATTRRDFAEAERIDPSRSADDLEALYGAIDNPTRMFAVQPFVVDAIADGSLWRLTGAAFAFDFDPEPSIRTHVICSEWEVDLANGTATWIPGTDQFLPDQQLPPDQFPDVYEATCT